MPSNVLYTYLLEDDASGDTVIGAAQFAVNGVPAASFAGLGPNAYAMLYLNGVPQEQNIYTLTASSLTIELGAATLYAGTPVMVQIVGFNVEVTGD
ncbi:DUF4183 domain-containing protein [Cohnella sp. 56]|uniref:DUF4183 domain-containing protein n=1 Tax=Cohnella sp. 56 TaxID=3113722 RepID=UPI0030E9E807